MLIRAQSSLIKAQGSMIVLEFYTKNYTFFIEFIILVQSVIWFFWYENMHGKNKYISLCKCLGFHIVFEMVVEFGLHIEDQPLVLVEYKLRVHSLR